MRIIQCDMCAKQVSPIKVCILQFTGYEAELGYNEHDVKLRNEAELWAGSRIELPVERVELCPDCYKKVGDFITGYLNTDIHTTTRH